MASGADLGSFAHIPLSKTKVATLFTSNHPQQGPCSCFECLAIEGDVDKNDKIDDDSILDIAQDPPTPCLTPEASLGDDEKYQKSIFGSLAYKFIFLAILVILVVAVLISAMTAARKSGSATENGSSLNTSAPPPGPSATPSTNIHTRYSSLAPSISHFETPTTSTSIAPFSRPTRRPTLRPNNTPTTAPSTVSLTQRPTVTPTLRPTLPPIPLPVVIPQPPTTTEAVIIPQPPPTPTFVPGELTVLQEGLFLSTGLQAQVIAESGQPVALANGRNSSSAFHDFPDFGAVFQKPDMGGWIYVSNSEVKNGDGGVGALTFNKQGQVLEYQMLLLNTSMNCGGGPTPWATWISCEERKNGRNWQVDPTGQRPPQQISLGSGDDGGNFESFAYDEERGHYFVTEDDAFGPLRRWIPVEHNATDPWSTLHGEGETSYLRLLPESENSGLYEWVGNKTLASNNANIFYPNAEGIDVYGRELYFVSKEIKTLFVLNLDNMLYTSHTTRKGLFDGQPDQLVRVLGNSMNNNTEEELLFFTEDGGLLAGVHARNRHGQYFTILESDGSITDDETTGLAFSPDHRFMYVAYQRIGKLFAISRQDGLPFTAKSLNVKYHTTT